MAPDVPAPADSPDIDINGNIGKQAICGTNSFVKTTFNTVCRIVATFKTTTQAWSVKCSAAKMGSNLLATAGHCVYSKTMVCSGYMPSYLGVNEFFGSFIADVEIITDLKPIPEGPPF